MINLANGIIGLMILTLGRKLFWLFVGCVGFVAGLHMADQYFNSQPTWMAWGVALLFGLAGAILGVFFQTIAIGIAGFVAGTTITAYITLMIGFTASPIINVLGGIIGTFALFVLFDWALIGLSSLVGATLVVQSLNWNSQFEMILYVGLIVIGVVFQTALWQRQSSRRD